MPLPLSLSPSEDDDSSNFETESVEAYNSDDNAKDLKYSLDQFLKSVETTGNFATSGAAPSVGECSLSVHNVGLICFPLKDAQANSIIGACHRAPFGKGSKTIVDESVRKTWELNSDQFDLLNPSWPLIVNQFAQKASQELGCGPEVSVSANLYKLLLYVEGAMFKPHTDTEKEPGMFGTLVFCLPSTFEGGSVVATHLAKSKVFEGGTHSSSSYIAWYADVTHEVKPITSGCRLVLVYNLIHSRQSPSQSPPLLEKQKVELSSLLSSWERAILKNNPIVPSALIYKLDHKYTDASLNFGALKGLDKIKTQYLREICPQTGVCIYLASMKHTKEGSCEDDGRGDWNYSPFARRGDSKDIHALEEVYEQNVSLDRVIDLDGHVIAREITIHNHDIVQENPFARDPDYEHYEGYTGNAGASATHVYNDTVLVLAPLRSRHSFIAPALRKGCFYINDWIKWLIASVKIDPANTFARNDLINLCQSILEVPTEAPNTQELRRRLRKYDSQITEPHLPIIASLMLEERHVFEEHIVRVPSMPLSIYDQLGTAMFVFDLPTDHTAINALINGLDTFNLRVQAVQRIVKSFQHAAAMQDLDSFNLPDNVATWAQSRISEALTSFEMLVRDDGLSLGHLLAKDKHQVSFVESLALANRFASNTAFLIAFMTQVMTHMEGGVIYENQGTHLFGKLINPMISHFHIQCQKSTKRADSGTTRADDHIKCLMNADDVVLLLDQLHYNYPEYIHQIIEKLVNEAGVCELIAFEHFYIPLLHEIIARTNEVAEEKSDDRSRVILGFQQPFRKILTSYIQRYVQPKPVQDKTWARPYQGCGRCHDCRSLDDFLKNPDLQSKRFPVGKKRRQHLHNILENTGHKHETDRMGVETLVVTKSVTYTDVKSKEWEKRFVEAQGQIESLEGGVLRELLGEEYDSIVQLRSVSESSEPYPPSRNTNPRKRHYDVIDLTS